jgi:hypothetical protein
MRLDFLTLGQMPDTTPIIGSAPRNSWEVAGCQAMRNGDVRFGNWIVLKDGTIELYEDPFKRSGFRYCIDCADLHMHDNKIDFMMHGEMYSWEKQIGYKTWCSDRLIESFRLAFDYAVKRYGGK